MDTLRRKSTWQQIERFAERPGPALLAPMFNYGAPRIAVSALENDGTLDLAHDHAGGDRGLDLERAEAVLKYVGRVWRRPVRLHTVDGDGNERMLAAEAA